MRFALVLVSASLGIACATTHAPQSSARPIEEEALNALYEREWQWQLAESPELATEVGDSRYNDRLQDRSFEAIERRKAHTRSLLTELERFHPDQLSAEARLSFELFGRDVRQEVEGQRFPSELLAISQFNGPQSELAELAQNQPRLSQKDFEDYLKRLAAAPRWIAQTEALLKEGLRKNVVPPEPVLAYVAPNLKAYLVTDATASPLYSVVFAELPGWMSAGDAASLRSRAAQLIREQVTPAFERFNTFFTQQYLPHARKEVGWWALPDGKDWYGYEARVHTTTTLSPEEMHAIGLKEVARIHSEMEQVKARTGFKGSMAEFFAFLRQDERFFFKSASTLLAAYRDLGKRIDPELVKQFGHLPRLPYGITGVPVHAEHGAPAAYYMPGSLSGGRAGMFYANTSDLKSRPSWEMESLTLHEAVPGHHLQIAIAQETESLPKFRRYGSYTAYIEGWGLYAESLGKDLGLYTDPYAYFGRLVNEMWRAIRLVVDTGMHAKHWTREQAIGYFVENAGRAPADIAVEIDRYIAWAGQALAYKMGELKLQELRHRSVERLGKRFDVRAFHDVVLSDGALPLDVLDQRIDTWINARQSSPE